MRRSLISVILCATVLVVSSIVDCSDDAITVNYSQPLDVMIKVGNYKWVNSDINAEHFSVRDNGLQKVEVQVVNLEERMDSEAIVVKLKESGLRPATLPELLAFGEKCPDEQIKHRPIIALGSVWQNSHGNNYVPILRMIGDKRDLDLLRWDGEWNEYCYRFLAISE